MSLTASIAVADPAVAGRVPQTRSAPQSRVKVDCFVVRVTRGADEDQGREAASCTDALAIGTSPGNHLVLADGPVSRHHCELTSTALGLYVRDLGSTNGTFIDGVRVARPCIAARAPDLAVGETTLAVEVAAEQQVESRCPAADRFGAPARRQRRDAAALRAARARRADRRRRCCSRARPAPARSSLAQAIHERSARARRSRSSSSTAARSRRR